MVRSLLFILILTPQLGHAIVNIESLRVSGQNQPLKGQLALAGDRKEGNSNTETLQLGGQVRAYSAAREQLALLKFKYGESQNVKNANQSLLHLRWSETASDSWAYEYYGQIEKNEFTRLAFRGLLGAGLRLKLGQINKSFLFFGTGAFFAQEKLDENNNINEELSQSFWRANNYLSWLWQLNSAVEFSTVIYFQPKIDSLSDYRLAVESALNFRISKTFSIGLDYSQSHDNAPPTGVRKTDHEYSTTLKWTITQ